MGSNDGFRVFAVAPGGDEQQASDWILALAGGEGTRLQDYVRRRFGWQLPKQYCPLLGSRSTLQDVLGMAVVVFGLACAACSVVVFGLACAACSPGYDIRLTADSTVTPGPSGVTIPIHVTSGDTPGGVALAMSAAPSTISLEPPTVTLKDGSGDTYALVPYGVSGSVGVSAAFATATPANVAAKALVLCPSMAVAADGGADIADAGEVFAVSVAVQTDGDCTASGTKAPAGVPIAFAISQNGGSAVTAMAATAATGAATANVLVPWSTEVTIQATAGGGSVSIALSGKPNPAVVECMGWTQSPPDVYAIIARVTDGAKPLPSMKVTFSVSSSAATVGAPIPAMIETGAGGTATTYVSLASNVALPVVIAATSGNSSSAVVLTTNASGGNCP